MPPKLSSESLLDREDVDALIEAAFGPGRLTKAAERLREGREPQLELSVVAKVEGELVGCVRQWTIWVGQRPVIFLGPIVVDPAWRSHGLGAALIEQACAAAWRAGHDVILLVGDAPFFQPLGFEVVPPGRLIMPAPVDPGRVLAKSRTPGAADDLAGFVTAG